MAIETIPNQPVLFRPAGWREPCPCENCDPDCMMIEHDDYIYAQVKMSPCGDDLICGQPVLDGTELLTNGTFTGSAAGWTLQAGWTYDTDNILFTPGSGANQVYQSGVALTVGKFYEISWEVTNATAGTTTPAMGNAVDFGTPETGNGVFSQVVQFTAPDTWAGILPSADFDGNVDNISCKLAHDCWTEADVAVDTTTTYTETNVCVNGSLSLISTVAGAALGSANRYVVTFVISNYVSGNVDLQFGSGNTIEGDFTSNGQKFAYDFFITDTNLALVFDNFIGCISEVHIYRLFIPQFVIENQATQQQYLELNDGAFVSFVQDRVIIKFRPLEFLPYDCYKICIVDTCLIAGDTNEVTNGTFESDLTDWSPGSGWAWSAGNGGQALFDRSIGTGGLSQEFSVSDITVCARITVYNIEGSGAFVRFHLRNAANNSVVFLDIDTPGVYSICGLANRIAVEPSNLAGTIVAVDNIGVFEVTDCEDCFAYDYCSNCINFKQNFDTCVLLIESYNNENGSWGFVWNDALGANAFKLSHRIAAKLWHPTYPEDSSDYTFSDGKTSDTFGLTDKFWVLGIDPESERAHDVIRLQKRSDHFVIEDINESREFWAEKGDYNPDWPDGGCRAPANIKVKLKTSTLFNNLCTE